MISTVSPGAITGEASSRGELDRFVSDLRDSGVTVERASLLREMYATALAHRAEEDWERFYIGVEAAVRASGRANEALRRLLSDDLGQRLFAH